MWHQFKTILVVCAFAGGLWAKTGTIEGMVASGEKKRPVIGVKVKVVGAPVHGVTDLSGKYRITQVETGERTVVFSAVGYEPDTSEVTVKENRVVTVDALLEQKIYELRGMNITGRLEGQTRAYNVQKTADNIKSVISADYIDRFPDQNSAEALQRVSGISVQRDQGEGRYVQIRGSRPAYTTVNVNGVGIPAPEGDDRTVALDVIPSDVLSQIEVNKAVTPEMDGGAIGGQVNLETRKAATQRLSLQASAALGYNALNGTRENSVAPLLGQGSVSLGKRFMDNKLGLLVGGSYLRANRGSDNNELDWSIDDDGPRVEYLEELQLRDYTVIRDRLGLNAVFDIQPTQNVSIFLSGLYNRFGDQEYRRRAQLAFGDPSDPDREIERELKDRYEVQDVLALRLGSEMKMGRFILEPHVAYSFAQEEEPNAYHSAFVTEPDNLTADWSNTSFPSFESSTELTDASAYEFDKLERDDNITNESNIEGGLSIAAPYTLDNSLLELKAGVKARRRNKMRDNTFEEYEWNEDAGDPITMDKVSGDYSNPEFLLEEYPNSADNFQGPDEIRDHFQSNKSSYKLASEADLLEKNWVEDYEATEDVGAGFLQGKYSLGKISALAGVRIEYTGMEYTGYEVKLIEDEVTEEVSAEVSELEGDENNIEVLPMIHLKYSPLDNMNIRFAYTRTFSRPGYYELVPYRLVEDNEVERGNPELENTTSQNFDLLGEYYFESVGAVTAGAFVKAMNNFIYTWKGEEVVGGTTFEVEQSVNGEDAILYGVELGLERQLSFLPGALNGFGIGGNYTYAFSEGEVKPTDKITRTISLPGQSQHVLNGYMQYEKYGVSARIAANYHTAFLDEVGSEEFEDEYYDDHFQLDLSLGYSIGATGLSLFADAVNLTNEPLRYYIEVDGDEYPLQQEYYSWWGSFGVKYSF